MTAKADLSDSQPQGAESKGSFDQIARQPSNAQGTVITLDDGGLVTSLTLVEETIEKIGMGSYQWQLALSCGFGFLVDQMLLVSISLAGPQASYEFSPKYATLLSAPQYAGLFLGAIVMGLLADVLGRRMVWQMSIFLVSVFAMLSAASPTWSALNVFVAFTGFFAGGNLAIDLTILAECLPVRWGFIMTGLAGVWGLGNAITGLIAWPLLTNFGCPSSATSATCKKEDNMGWRYLYITVGGLCLGMAAIRALVIRSRESPKWLIANGRVDEAVQVLNAISSTNKSDHKVSSADFSAPTTECRQSTLQEKVHKAIGLFKGKSQLQLMLCLIVFWALIGITYPLYTIFLPYYLQAHGSNLGDSSSYITYRDWAVSSVVGIFGPFVSMALVSSSWFRSRRSITITAFICAIFSGAFTNVKTEAQNLASSCMINFWLNALYAIIYAYTPQVLQTENRGLGCGLLMACGRIASLSAPFIATFSDVTSSAPIWISCALYVVMGFLAFGLPTETASFGG